MDADRNWFEDGRRRWSRLQQALGRQQQRRHAELRELVDGYAALPHDIARAERLAPDSPLVDGLRALYLSLHERLFEPPRNVRESFRNWLREGLPASVRAMRTELVVATLLFLAAAGVGVALIQMSLDLAPMFLPKNLIHEVESGKLWTERIHRIAPPGVLSASIATNNVMVALAAFVLGTLYGVGTLYIVGLNGLLLGGTFAFVHHHGLSLGLFRFVVAHGLVELSIIVLAAAAGLHLGDALVNPGNRSRQQAFAEAIGRALPLMAFCVVMLLGCGLIEGYLSPHPAVPLSVRIAVGVGWWVVFAALLYGPWRRPR